MLDSQLKLQTYLVGHSISLADICLAQVLLPLFRFYLGPEQRKALSCLSRWFSHIVCVPAFRNVNGNVSLCAVPLVADLEQNAKMQQERVAAA